MAEADRDDGRQVVAVLKSTDMQARFRESLPPNVSVDKFTRVVATAVAQRPELLAADRTSLYLAATQAAKDGLLPDGREGVLNIYRTNVGTREAPRWVQKVQWMPMVEGVIKQLAKAGIRVTAASVHRNDKFRFWTDDEGQHIEHEPALFSTDRGDRIGAYAIGVTAEGYRQIEAMNADELAKARAASKNKDGKIFADWPDRMEQKTVIHRLRKRMAIADDDVREFLDRDMKDEMEDDDPPPAPAPEPATVVAANRPRSKTLQSVVDHQKHEQFAAQAPAQVDDAPPPTGEDDF